MKKNTTKKIIGFYRSRGLLFGLIGLGIVLQSRQYIFNRSLWMDEGVLSFSIAFQPFRDLILSKTAPPGFCAIVKSLSMLFGHTEYVLRLFPFVCGVSSLFLFLKVAERYLSRSAAPIALFLFATNDRMIWYASEVKQYSCDVMVSLLLLLMASYINIRDIDSKKILLWGSLGIAAILTSFPSIFLLGSISLCLIICYFEDKRATNLKKILCIPVVWLSGFMASYFFIISNMTNRSSLRHYWSGEGAAYRSTAFMPIAPSSLSDLLWLPKTFIDVIRDPLGFYFYPLAGLLMLYGSVKIFSANKKIFTLLFLPVVVTLAASAFQMYPFRGRLVMFLLPSFLFFLSEGIVRIRVVSSKYSLAACVLCMTILSSYPAYKAGIGLISPRKGEEVRSVLKYIKNNYRPGDTVYCYYGAAGPFKYYMRQLDLDEDNCIFGTYIRGKLPVFKEDIARMLHKMKDKSPRIWLVFAHKYALRVNRVLYSEETVFLYHLDRIGKRLDSFMAEGASGYLYDFSMKPDK